MLEGEGPGEVDFSEQRIIYEKVKLVTHSLSEINKRLFGAKPSEQTVIPWLAKFEKYAILGFGVE